MATDYPKKYWWLILIVIPVVVAVIQVTPSFFNGDGTKGGDFYVSHNHFNGNMYFTGYSTIERDYKQLFGQALTDQTLKDRLQKAVNLAKGQNYAGAIPLFEEIAQSVPLPAIYNNLGVLYAQMQDSNRARQAYDRVVELNPDYEPVHLNMGLLDESQGRLREAARHYEKSSALKGAKQRTKEIEEEIAKGIFTRELEPNDNIRMATPVLLATPVNGELLDASESDYFCFTTPPDYRDIMRVTLQNRSTTLGPEIEVYNKDRSNIRRGTHDVTAGANIETSFSVKPNSTYYIAVESFTGYGAYTVKIDALKAYDAFEQNETIPCAAAISLSKPVDAGIMDREDVDFYAIETSAKSGTVAILIENRSTTLGPGIEVYNEDRSDMRRGRYDSTQGANIRSSFPAQANSKYYIKVYGWTGYGDYTLTVEEMPADSQ